MTTRHRLRDAGHCFRAAAPPLLALSVLALARATQGEPPAPRGVGELILLAWWAAVLGTLVWFLTTVIWAAFRPLRDRRAFQRLQHLREIATDPDRALVHVQTVVWSSTAGQDVVVVNVATGSPHRVWLPETTVPIDAFAVLERALGGESLVDWMKAHHVEAGHRHERREATSHPTRVKTDESFCVNVECEVARLLTEEIERYLKEQRHS